MRFRVIIVSSLFALSLVSLAHSDQTVTSGTATSVLTAPGTSVRVQPPGNPDVAKLRKPVPMPAAPTPGHNPNPDCAQIYDCDGDGHDQMKWYGKAEARGPADDCDDDDANRYPGNLEVGDSRGHDEDCNASTLGPDGDGDGFPSTNACNYNERGALVCGLDCDDTRSTVSPTAVEACDTIDNNCNGQVDEGVVGTYYRDIDGDGFGAGPPLMMCVAPANGSLRNTDCDDKDPLVHPGQFELKNNKDDNCNGQVDEAPRVTVAP